jgi:acarbose 7IV-phosphotransferase
VALGDPLVAVRAAVLCAGWKVGGTPDEEPGIARRQLAELIGHLPPAVLH